MSNYLKDSRAYLGGPIEHGTGSNWRHEPIRQLIDGFGIKVFDPYADPKQQWVPNLNKARDESDYETMHSIAKQFVRKDLCIVDRSDFGIWSLPYKVPTTGSHHEIIVASNAKKPTLLVCEQGKNLVPAWYYGFIPHQYMFGSWNELYDYLEEVREGKHFEDDRWSYIYQLV